MFPFQTQSLRIESTNDADRPYKLEADLRFFFRPPENPMSVSLVAYLQRLPATEPTALEQWMREEIVTRLGGTLPQDETS